MKDLIESINDKLKISIKNRKLFNQAFHHSSYTNEFRKKGIESNERLEFLGDAVLELAISDYLYRTYPEASEGFLTRMRAQLVRESSLAYIARENYLDRYIKLGKGELSSGGNQRDSILADTFEALLGAIYLDQGMDIVIKYLQSELFNKHQLLLKTINQDYKTKFQELIQQQGNVKIEYRLLDQKGPAHNQEFEMGLYINDQYVSKGTGKSKKIAEMEAARQAFELKSRKE